MILILKTWSKAQLDLLGIWVFIGFYRFRFVYDRILSDSKCVPLFLSLTLIPVLFLIKESPRFSGNSLILIV